MSAILRIVGAVWAGLAGVWQGSGRGPFTDETPSDLRVGRGVRGVRGLTRYYVHPHMRWRGGAPEAKMGVRGGTPGRAGRADAPMSGSVVGCRTPLVAADTAPTPLSHVLALPGRARRGRHCVAPATPMTPFQNRGSAKPRPVLKSTDGAARRHIGVGSHKDGRHLCVTPHRCGAFREPCRYRQGSRKHRSHVASAT